VNLSPNFTLAEYTTSESAARLEIDNTPPPELMGNLKRMAGVMEEIRAILGKPIKVTSGYRCLDLNRALRSNDTSAHVLGLATDFICPAYGVPYDVCRAIVPHMERLGIDQLIYEHTWVHVGLKAGDARHQVLTLAPGNRYVAGIVTKGSLAA